MSKVSPANQHTSDDREQPCWDYYVESVNAGKPNATKAALKAGYHKDTARNITIQGWFKARMETLRRKEMLSKAEIVLEHTLNKYKRDPKLAQDTAKFVAKTLGKKDYSERVDLTTNGEKIEGIVIKIQK